MRGQKRARPRLAQGIWLVACFAFAACAAADTTVSLADYNRSCSAANECAPVRSGDLCAGSCDCPNSAINKADVSRFQADATQKIEGCSEKPLACPCVPPQVVCDQGTCALE